MPDGSTLGIHRFSKSTASPYDLDIGQIVSGTIISYLSEMGVDVALFGLMSQVDSAKMRIIPATLAKRYQVVNNGYQPASWSIKALHNGGGVYLVGMQQAWYGMGKVSFMCTVEGGIFFQAFYEAGENSQAIIAGAVRHSFRVDDMFLPLEEPAMPLFESNGYVVATFLLPKEYIPMVFKANTVGYAAHPLNPRVFWGFTVDMDNRDEKINGFIKSCKERPR